MIAKDFEEETNHTLISIRRRTKPAQVQWKKSLNLSNKHVQRPAKDEYIRIQSMQLDSRNKTNQNHCFNYKLIYIKFIVCFWIKSTLFA